MYQNVWLLRLIVAFGLFAEAHFCQAQSASQAADYQRTIARVQLNLVKKEVVYQGRFSRTESLAKTEQYRQELVASGESATKKLLSLLEFQARVSLRAIALRVAQAQTQGFAVDYKHVNELSIYEGNSLEARRAYYAAFDAALHKTVLLSDSMRAARQNFADEFNLLLDNQEMRVIDQWLSVQHRIVDLFHYQHQIILPVIRTRTSMKTLIQAVGSANIPSFEKARRMLAAEVATAKSELAIVPDFINLDVLYRNAARELVNVYGELCTNELAHISVLLKENTQPTPAQMEAVNQNLADFTAKLNAANLAYEEAGKAFFKSYRPVLDEDNRHSGY